MFSPRPSGAGDTWNQIISHLYCREENHVSPEILAHKTELPSLIICSTMDFKSLSFITRYGAASKSLVQKTFLHSSAAIFQHAFSFLNCYLSDELFLDKTNTSYHFLPSRNLWMQIHTSSIGFVVIG